MNFLSHYRPKEFLDDTVILINTCDKNADVLSLLLKSLDKNWSDNPFPIMINTESSKVIKKKFYKKKINWGKRFLLILKSLKYKYVILLLDDYILEEKIEMNMVNKAIAEVHENTNVAAFYLNYCTGNEIKSGDFYELKAKRNDRLNSHPAVWKRKDLIMFTEEYDTPWSWETFGSYRIYYSNKKFYSVSSKEKNIYKYDCRLGGAVYRGKWVKEVVAPMIKEYQDVVDFSQREFVKINEPSKRPLKWKITFLYLGFKTLGFRMFEYIFDYLKKKLM
jgi:hypothetical protein